MEKNFAPVTDLQTLDSLVEQSNNAPVVLFKHSTTCPISMSAYQEMSRLDAPVSLIVVQRSRDISREIETRTGIRHESPQVIILRHGQPVWSASHFDITADAVEEKLHTDHAQ